MTIFRLIFYWIISGLVCMGCTNQKSSATHGASIPGPPCIIYKTKKDYYQNVPVMLSEDKLVIVSFPDPKDLFFNGELAFPERLEEGYLLDNRGIGPNVAFLKITYDEYSRLTVAPGADELFRMIMDADPLVVMYDCGRRNQFSNPVDAMNQLIRTGKLTETKRLK